MSNQLTEKRTENKAALLERELSLYAKKTIKREMGKNLIKVPELAKKLEMNPDVLSKKISRATFSVGFFLRTLQELETTEMKIPLKEEVKTKESSND